MEDSDAQLQLKKRARRRLIGALVFVSIAAVVLPLVMDQEPRQAVQDVEIRIPGQDDKAFAPKFEVAPTEKPATTAQTEAPRLVASEPAAKPTARVIETSNDKVVEKAPEKPIVAKADKELEKTVKPPEKQSEKPVDKQKMEEAKRAAAILAGQAAEPAKPSSTAKNGGDHLILIGAFSNEENVKILKTKLSELGIKAYTEPLDTPQGRKTRVRAGPFASRDAAEKALEKMKKIGVSGVVAAKP